MYAVIRQGGHQYKVQPGDIIQVELIDAEKGQEVVLEEVLALKSGEELKVGAPRVTGASVKARVLRNDRGPKVRIYKFRRRKNSSRTRGHRQSFTELKIVAVLHNGQEVTA